MRGNDMINYDGKIFIPLKNSDNGQVSQQTVFYYRQKANVVTGEYSGGEIVSGHLIALVQNDGSLDMRYHHIDVRGELKTGKCLSVPEALSDGRIRLHEHWQWTCSDLTTGSSVIEEIRAMEVEEQ
jgi:hypothetical protein